MATEKLERFISYLNQLNQSNRAAIAILRRSLSFPPGTYPAAYPYVEPFLADASESQRKAFYLVAAFYALHPHASNVTLAKAMGQLFSLQNNPSLELRFITLLESDTTTLSERLRHVITYLKSKDSGIDYVRLLSDCWTWFNEFSPNYPDNIGRLRQRWAKDFYSQTQSTNI